MKLRALVVAGLLALTSTTVLADFARVGPLNVPSPPGNGFPKWYQDLTGLVLDICLPDATDPGAAQQAACLLTGIGVNPPYVFPTNYPDEIFYFRATSLLNTSATLRATLVLALEAAFANGGPAPGDQMVFARIRVTAGVPFPGTYRVIHPWGEEKFVDVQASGANRDIVFTEDIGITPGDFQAALKGRAGPFLTRVPPAGETTFVTIGTAQFLSDGVAPERVTGSRFGTNVFSMCGPFDGPTSPDRCIDQPLFTLTGRVHNMTLDPIPSPMTVQRATYTRDGANTWVDVSASALPAIGVAVPKLSVGAVGLPPVLLNGPTTLGGYYAQGLAVPPEAVPGIITLINSSDNPPSVLKQALADEVTILSATYNAGTLTVVATSSDKGAGAELSPALVLEGYPVGPNVTVSPRGFVAGDPASVQIVATGLTAPPASAVVISTAGGVARLDPSIAKAAPFPPGVPLAMDDFAQAVVGLPPVSIAVVANDLINADPAAAITNPTPEILPPGLSPAGFGTLSARADGTVLFQPSTLTGTGTFRYVVANGIGKSNPATVSITVVPGAAGPFPNPQNDTATVFNGSSVTIPVTANDLCPGCTIDTASVVISAQAAVGTAVANANGSVTYSVPSGSAVGPQTFTYTVATTTGNRAAASVTVTVVNPENPTVTAAKCTNGPKWDVRGTAPASINGTVTLYLVSPVPATPTAAQTLGTANVDATGAWRFTAGTASCRTPISLKTSAGSILNAISVTLR